MSFFNRILNFSQEAVRQREQRRSQRYPTGAAFPLQATLTLSGRTPATAWTGTLTDLSAHGTSVRLPAGAAATRGEPGRLRLAVEEQQLEVAGTIANLRAHPDHTICGFELQFPEFNTHKNYMQLLEAVALGAMLAPADARFVRQDAPGLHKEKYSGEADTELILWREAPGGAIDSFEFRMNDCFVRGHRRASGLEIYTQETVKDELKSGYTQPTVHPNTATQEEIRRLYRWVVPNFAPAVPDDVRRFLAGFAN
ncbi:MAG: PilZ domain-containing protein [Opitutales bacterium]